MLNPDYNLSARSTARPSAHHKPRRILSSIAVSIIFAGSLLSSPDIFAKDTEEAVPTLWLPARLKEALQADLDAIIEHAATRRACATILEAKFSNASSELNPKFIVTCESAEYGTTNLVYWKTDVEQGFANVLYEAKNDGSAKELELSPIDLEYSKDQQLAMVDSCRTAVNNEFIDKLPTLAIPSIDLRLRGSAQLAIYMSYAAKNDASNLLYTATCLIKPDGEPKVDLFSR